MTGTFEHKALWIVDDDCVISAGFSASFANHGFYVNGRDMG
jgi:hypothetical protein